MNNRIITVDMNLFAKSSGRCFTKVISFHNAADTSTTKNGSIESMPNFKKKTRYKLSASWVSPFSLVSIKQSNEKTCVVTSAAGCVLSKNY